MRFFLALLPVVALLAGPTLTAQAAAPTSEKLAIQHVSSYVDYISVLPGERFPLRAADATGRIVPVRWTAQGGDVAHASNAMAIWKAPLKPGAYRVTGAATVNGRTYTRSLSMIVTVPAANVRNGKLNGYPIGSYPRGFGEKTMLANRGSRDDYRVPNGFVELSSATMDVPLSRHYKLRDFAGKDAFVGGKKYLFVQPKLVEKLERATAMLEAQGARVGKLELMSAYRSPWLNAAIGNTTTLSRHTYGDAADVIVKDFNRDGRADATDANLLAETFNRLDQTELIGGGAIYKPNAAHGYFVHTDTRGNAARW